jgi:cytochrome b
VIAFIASYLSEGEIYLHFYVGWYIAIMLVLRFFWGIVGSKYARFADFIKSPSEIISYAKSLFQSKKITERFIGHNPLGGAMIIALMLSLTLTCTTGVVLYSSTGAAPFAFIGEPITKDFEEDEVSEKLENQFKLEQFSTSDQLHEDDEAQEENEHFKLEQFSTSDQLHEDDEAQEENEHFWKEIHEFFANFTLFLILLHIAGVFYSSKLENENLAKAMITGVKHK